ncbi:MAG: hypothetical protein FE78DRAFT_89509, partial [Acidomyces sp. 'richmondensis']
MLRTAVLRGVDPGVARGLAVRGQWLRPRIQHPLISRAYAADGKASADSTLLPGSQSGTVGAAGVPQPPILNRPSPATPETPNPPKPPPPPPASTAARKPKRRFRSFFLTLLVLSALGYAGGIYASLVNDNFHDFFTEYVPGGEEAVAYFEEREYRKRFPPKEFEHKQWPQTRGEHKVTIGRQSGVTPRTAAKVEGSDLGTKGRHVSAVEEPKPSSMPSSPEKKADASQPRGPAEDKSVVAAPKADADQKHPSSTGAAPTAAATLSPVDLPPPTAQEPAAQKLVKMVNNLLTALNALPPDSTSPLSSTISTMKQDLATILADIADIKTSAASQAEHDIAAAHTEFDHAAQELVRRLETDMRAQESRWREEYETERERLARSYESKLDAELAAAQKVADAHQRNALLQQEIVLQRAQMDRVRAAVESEREGRLARLDELVTAVHELESLTAESNALVDHALRTQHLSVAVEALRAKILDSHAQQQPQPFLTELVALKTLASDSNPVVSAAIASIPPVAYQTGLPPLSHLLTRFRSVAAEVRKASLLPADAGVASHAASAVLSRFMFPKTSSAPGDMPAGEDVEAVLARAQMWLEEGDLEGAVREVNSLQGWAGVLSRDWVGEGRRCLEVRQAVDV